MKISIVIPEAAWVVDRLLSPEECKDILQRAQEHGIDSSTSSRDTRYRNDTGIHFHDSSLASILFSRLKQHLDDIVVNDNSKDNNGLKHSLEKLRGRWRPVGINERFGVSRYDALGHFGPHRDEGRVDHDNRMSLLTLVGYLVDRPEGSGGATRFIRDDLGVYQTEDGLITSPEDAVLHRIEADKAGKALLFLHDLMHDGEPLQENAPSKWIFRTDIMFERDPETAPQLTETQRQARRLLREAEAMEQQRDFVSAMKLYNKAYRLNPSLEHPSS